MVMSASNQAYVVARQAPIVEGKKLRQEDDVEERRRRSARSNDRAQCESARSLEQGWNALPA